VRDITDLFTAIHETFSTFPKIKKKMKGDWSQGNIPTHRIRKRAGGSQIICSGFFLLFVRGKGEERKKKEKVPD